MASQPVTCLAEITLPYLQGVVGRRFATHDPEGRPIGLKLVSVTDMRPRRRPDPEPAPSAELHGGALVACSALGLEREPVPFGPRRIGLLFEGPRDRPLPDDEYDLELPWLPLFGLRLTPLEVAGAPAGAGIHYEAVLD